MMMEQVEVDMKWQGVLHKNAKPWHKRINKNQVYRRVIRFMGEVYNKGNLIRMTPEEPHQQFYPPAPNSSRSSHFFHKDGPFRKWLELDMVFTIASEMWATMPTGNPGETRRDAINEQSIGTLGKRLYENNTSEEWWVLIDECNLIGWPDYLESDYGYDTGMVGSFLPAPTNHIIKAQRAVNSHLTRMFVPPFSQLHSIVVPWLPKLGWKSVGSKVWRKE